MSGLPNILQYMADFVLSPDSGTKKSLFLILDFQQILSIKNRYAGLTGVCILVEVNVHNAIIKMSS